MLTTDIDNLHPPTAFIMALPAGVVLEEKKRYYFTVSNKHWKDGEPQRMRMKPERARRLAMGIDYIVAYTRDQSNR